MADEVVPIVAAVDDDFRVRESLQSLLESAGFRPVVFSSGEEFLNSGSLAAATCVITDVRMPGMDGIELQRRIRQVRPNVPVILISAHYDAEVRRIAIDEGAVDILYKPFDAAKLLTIIQAALAKSPKK